MLYLFRSEESVLSPGNLVLRKGVRGTPYYCGCNDQDLTRSHKATEIK
jgi:hypothetical protein